MAAVKFEGNDEAYIGWLRRNPDGFLVNTVPRNHLRYLMLHRATCKTIRGYHKRARRGAYTERQYIKVCARNVAELERWLRSLGHKRGKFDQCCSRCEPV